MIGCRNYYVKYFQFTRFMLYGVHINLRSKYSEKLGDKINYIMQWLELNETKRNWSQLLDGGISKTVSWRAEQIQPMRTRDSKNKKKVNEDFFCDVIKFLSSTSETASSVGFLLHCRVWLPPTREKKCNFCVVKSYCLLFFKWLSCVIMGHL